MLNFSTFSYAEMMAIIETTGETKSMEKWDLYTKYREKTGKEHIQGTDEPNYRHIIGKMVKGTVNRPLGTSHFKNSFSMENYTNSRQ